MPMSSSDTCTNNQTKTIIKYSLDFIALSSWLAASKKASMLAFYVSISIYLALLLSVYNCAMCLLLISVFPIHFFFNLINMHHQIIKSVHAALWCRNGFISCKSLLPYHYYVNLLGVDFFYPFIEKKK